MSKNCDKTVKNIGKSGKTINYIKKSSKISKNLEKTVKNV